MPTSLATTLTTLANAGRHPKLPCECQWRDKPLNLEKALRIFPNRRLTATGHWGDTPVIAKLFFGDAKARKEAEQEAANLRQLAQQKIPAPALLADSEDTAEGRLLLLEYLPGDSLKGRYEQAHQQQTGKTLVKQLMPFIAQLHAQDCLQQDPHPGNFLLRNDHFYLLDAGGVTLKPHINTRERCHNLAAILAQFYPADTCNINALRQHYGHQAPAATALKTALQHAQQKRHQHALDKIFRNCTEFSPLHVGPLNGMAARPFAAALQALLENDIDAVMEAGDFLKRGNSSSVSRVQWQGHDWVIKRYNIKSAAHRLKKQFKPSRAKRSWRNARWINHITGLATPNAIGFLESRQAGLLGTAYYICEHIKGTPVDQLTGDAQETAKKSMPAVFELMQQLHFNHGDMKASNFLWDGKQLWILDLDAMQIQLSARKAKPLIARDRNRWAQNWAH